LICTNCYERLYEDTDKLNINDSEWKGSVLILAPAFLAACFFTFFTVFVAQDYPFLWGLLPLPWIALGISWKWHLIGGVFLILLNVLPYIAGSIITDISSGESLGLAMMLPFFIALYNGPLSTAGIVLIVLRLRKG